MRVKTLRLVTFRGIQELDLHFEPRLTVLAGENGSGKTTVLDALAILLSHYVARVGGSAGRARKLAEADLRIGSGELSPGTRCG
jgi:recombinational DNA repair ATPase RecF